MQQYIVGNWKMNGTKADAKKLAAGFLQRLQATTRPLPHIIVCPSYPHLAPVVDILKDSPIEVGAQDCHSEKSGAYTGDVSPSQLIDVGCKYVIIGHSERRRYHQENSISVRKKVEAAIKAGLRPIVCIGESQEERESGKALEMVSDQLASDLPQEFFPHDMIVAYEPVWAIGTGRTPTLEQIEQMLGLIKHELSMRISGGALIPTIYGGSVNGNIAAGILNLSHVDGLLVGNASLILDEFWKIINASER